MVGNVPLIVYHELDGESHCHIPSCHGKVIINVAKSLMYGILPILLNFVINILIICKMWQETREMQADGSFEWYAVLTMRYDTMGQNRKKNTE